MKADRASWTSLAAAANRAIHLIADDPAAILRDELALRFIGKEAEDALRANAAAFRTREHGTLRTLAVIRNRYAEDRLRDATARGIRQYVILGAGLDSFAFREPELMQRLRVFEVDHPATQESKRERLSKLGVAVPSSLVFAPVDFETEALAQGLERVGFRRDEPTFFSWLGVTLYLTDAAIASTLEFVASCAVGSEIVFEYALPLHALDDEDRALLQSSIERCAARGEPFISSFEPAPLAQRLRSMGFSETADFGSAEAQQRYLAGRSDSLWFSDMAHLMWARR